MIDTKATIDTAVFYDKRLNKADKIIYLYLKNVAKKGKARASNREFSARCGCSRITAMHSILKLEGCGFISVERRFVQGKYSKGLTPAMNVYTILSPVFDYSKTQEAKYETEILKGNLEASHLKDTSK
jgi:hypothetical protein